MPSNSVAHGDTALWPDSPPLLVCLLCAREVAELVDGRLVHHPGCQTGFVRSGGRLRCCGCGGPLALDHTVD